MYETRVKEKESWKYTNTPTATDAASVDHVYSPPTYSSYSSRNERVCVWACNVRVRLVAVIVL